MSADNLSDGIVLLFRVMSWGATYLVHSTCLIFGIWMYLRRRQAACHALREMLWKTALVGGVLTASVQMWLAPLRSFGDFTLKLEGVGMAAIGSTATPAAKDSVSSDRIAELQQAIWAGRILDGDGVLDDKLLSGDSSINGAIAAFDSEREIATGLAVTDGDNPARDRLITGRLNPSRWKEFYGAVVGSQSAFYIGLVAIAMLAIVLGIFRYGWQTISLRRKLARCRLIQGGPARELLDELLRVVPRAPQVRLLAAPDDSEPAAFGIARWTIVLPPRAAFDLTEDELRALLAHELAHLVRGDSLWLHVSRAVCSCLAFQPLNHLARREWQRTAELLCDNWAVSRTGAPLALARCLTEVASWRLAGPSSAAILAATGRKSGLVDRIERLLDARPGFEHGIDLRVRRQMVFAGAIVLAGLAYCAPRVQLVVAAQRDKEQVVEGLQLADSVASVRVAEVGDSGSTDAAKPQASGQRQETIGGLQEAAESASNATAAQGQTGDIPSLLASLDSDLAALADELEQLGPLLADNAAPQVVALAKRLRSEIVRLQHRRKVLTALSQAAVK